MCHIVPICIALARRMGYDSITGVAMVVCGAFVGSSVGTFNLYATAIAQGIAGMPIFSAAWYRIIMHIVILIAGCNKAGMVCESDGTHLSGHGDHLRLLGDTREADM